MLSYWNILRLDVNNVVSKCFLANLLSQFQIIAVTSASWWAKVNFPIRRKTTNRSLVVQHSNIHWYVVCGTSQKSSGEIYGDHVVVFGMTFEGLPLHVDISTASYASLIRLVKFSCRFPESTHSICDKTHSRRFYVPKLISERKADFETRWQPILHAGQGFERWSSILARLKHRIGDRFSFYQLPRRFAAVYEPLTLNRIPFLNSPQWIALFLSCRLQIWRRTGPGIVFGYTHI